MPKLAKDKVRVRYADLIKWLSNKEENYSAVDLLANIFSLKVSEVIKDVSKARLFHTLNTEVKERGLEITKILKGE